LEKNHNVNQIEIGYCSEDSSLSFFIVIFGFQNSSVAARTQVMNHIQNVQKRPEKLH